MANILESRLEHNGASLYYRIYGPEKTNLPLLVVVPASNGSSIMFEGLATHLSASFRVVLYDRRGYSRSPADEDRIPAIDKLYEVHAEDLASLIKHVSPPPRGSFMARPVCLFTTSASVPIVLELILRNPYIIQQAVLHEPVIVSVCDRQRAASYWTLGGEVVNAARKNDFTGASAILRKQLYTTNEWKLFRSSEAALNTAKAITPADLLYYFGTEVGAIKNYRLDVARLTDMLPVPCPKEKCVIVQGRDDRPDLARTPGIKLAEIMQTRVEHIAGGHVGYTTHIKQFADELLELFRPCLLASRAELKGARL